MEELIQEIRLLREEVAGLRKAVESRPTKNGAFKAKLKAEELMNGFDENERKVVGMALSRIEWLIGQNKPAKFDDGLIVLLLGKQGITVERQWVKDVFRKMMMRNIMTWDSTSENDWFWRYGSVVEGILSDMDASERASFFKALYFSKK